MSIRMRMTKSKTRMRRSHHGLKEPRLSKCSNCGSYHLRHRMCDNCGYYRGKMVKDFTVDIEKKDKKLKTRQQEAQNMGMESRAEKKKSERDSLDSEEISKK